MNRQNVIVVIAPTLEVWGNFKKLCEAKGFDILPYHSLKSKPFPIIHNLTTVERVNHGDLSDLYNKINKEMIPTITQEILDILSPGNKS